MKKKVKKSTKKLSKRQQWQEKAAQYLCALNGGKKRISIGQARESVKDMIEFEKQARMRQEPSPLLFLMICAEEDLLKEVSGMKDKMANVMASIKSAAKKVAKSKLKVKRGSK